MCYTISLMSKVVQLEITISLQSEIFYINEGNERYARDNIVKLISTRKSNWTFRYDHGNRQICFLEVVPVFLFFSFFFVEFFVEFFKFFWTKYVCVQKNYRVTNHSNVLFLHLKICFLSTPILPLSIPQILFLTDYSFFKFLKYLFFFCRRFSPHFILPMSSVYTLKLIGDLFEVYRVRWLPNRNTHPLRLP